MLTRLGVCGWPIAHSRSPAMHNAALAALGMHDWRYSRLGIPPELFEETVRALAGVGFRGVNVTVPHKEAALALADEVTDTARAVGAANTLALEDRRILADNTDVRGLLDSIPSHHHPAGRRALVLGAGGAGRAAVHALLSAGAADVAVWNRTHERAERLCAELGGRAVLRPEPADIVVQCTTAGSDWGPDPFKALPISADTFLAGSCVVDMVYRAHDTDFLAAARSRGADVIAGSEILVAQGAASFERWTGEVAPREVMRRAVMDTIIT